MPSIDMLKLPNAHASLGDALDVGVTPCVPSIDSASVHLPISLTLVFTITLYLMPALAVSIQPSLVV